MRSWCRCILLLILGVGLASCSRPAVPTKVAEPVATVKVTPHSPASLRLGQPAPEIEGEDLDGQIFKLSDYRGKVVLLDFWGHW
jgi:hypothetical protein